MRKSLGLTVAMAAWTFSATSLAANGATFLSQNVPASVQAGEQFVVDVTMQNAGDTAWTQGGGYFLGSQKPQDNTTWGTNRIAMDPADYVAPAASYVFHATLTAPGQAGDYDFQWQVLQDAVEWFGQATPNLVIHVAAAPPMTCDGTEKICLTLKDAAEIQATGATIAGDVSGDGFMPADQGGLDWHFAPADGLCSGRMEVDVKGLLPQATSGEPEQVSVFETCGEGAEANQVIGLQRMMLGYHGNNIFRYYATTDFNQFGWQLGIWTDGFEATGWTSEQTHHFEASWTSDGGGGASLSLAIDGQSWNASGDLPFNPQTQVLTIANRCTHYPTQQAVARFSNLRVWANGGCEPVVVQDAGSDTGADSSVFPDATAPDGGGVDSGWTPTGGSGGNAGGGGASTDGSTGGQGGQAASAPGANPETSDSGCGCRSFPRRAPLGGVGGALLALGWVLRRFFKRGKGCST